MPGRKHDSGLGRFVAFGLWGFRDRSMTKNLPAMSSTTPKGKGLVVGMDRLLPPAIAACGAAAEFAWDEFFTAGIRNPHTRIAYSRAVRQFLEWLEA